MAQSIFLLSTLFGLVLIATLFVISGRGWRSYSLPADSPLRRDSERSLVAELAEKPAVWAIAFVVLALAFGGATVLVVSGESIPASVGAAAGGFLVAAAATVFVVYLFYGTFNAAKGRGIGNAAAAALGSWALGLLFLVVMVTKLMGVF